MLPKFHNHVFYVNFDLKKIGYFESIKFHKEK